jgi:PAS domain S-box-containing protein
MDYTSTILIVDDEQSARNTAEALLEGQGYQVVFATNGREALTIISRLMPDLVLLDVMMPGIDGFEVCRRIRTNPMLSEVPILMVTGLDDRESRLQAIQAGADDFISKPFDSTELRSRIRTVTRLNRYRRLMDERSRFERVFELAPDGLMIVNDVETIILTNNALRRMLDPDGTSEQPIVGQSLRAFIPPEFIASNEEGFQRFIDRGSHGKRFEIEMVRVDGTRFAAEVMSGYMVWDSTPAAQVSVRDVTERSECEEQVEKSMNDINLAYDATLVGMVRALDQRNRETEGHTHRVTEMTIRLARALNIQGEDLEHIRRGAMLHDIGKLCIPEDILFKPGPLTEEEWAIVRQHPTYAYEWLYPIVHLRPALDIPYCHHEKWDGTGYPRGLKGEEIPLAARLFAIVDVWESLRSRRPYRYAWDETTVRGHIRSLAGSHFESRLVETFLTLYCPFT